MQQERKETTPHPVSDVLHRILLMALQGNGPVTQNQKKALMLLVRQTYLAFHRESDVWGKLTAIKNNTLNPLH